VVSNKIISVVGFNLPSDIASGRIAEMHRRICHALHDIFFCASRSKNAEGILELVIDRTTQSGTAEISPLLSKWIAEAFFIYKI